jgi:hypothetical protein
MRSWYDKRFRYEVGGIYEVHCDANCDRENSFGLSLWDRFGAISFYSKGVLLKVRAKIGDVKSLVHKNHKIRCSHLEILSIEK